jgi:hypothetical protein
VTKIPSSQQAEERVPAEAGIEEAAQPNPLFVATVFKSGTKLLEYLLQEITGLPARQIGMDIGNDYERVDPITFENKEIFIWHSTPTEQTRKRLVENNASAIFIIRNIYDLAVSQYFHFALDVDAEIGHATETCEYFDAMTQNEGISLVLCGAQSNRFTWPGFGSQLYQIQEMLKFKLLYPSVPTLVVNYDRLVQDKENEIGRLGSFVGNAIEPEMMASLLEDSGLEAMREARKRAAGTGLHFRKGTPGGHVDVLLPQHYDMINHLLAIHAPALPRLCEETDFTDIFKRA